MWIEVNMCMHVMLTLIYIYMLLYHSLLLLFLCFEPLVLIKQDVLIGAMKQDSMTFM